MEATQQNTIKEFSFLTNKTYKDPFNEVELDVLFTHESGKEYLVPAFWAGGNVWKARFSSPVLGRYSYKTVCSDASDSDLLDITGELEVLPYSGDNPLLKHGPVRVAADKKHFEHEDGKLFFWLADTWWMALCKRLKWPKGFQTLTLDRVEKGFTVVQIVAGFYPDLGGYDERNKNEGGFPWLDDYAGINPAYFDYADRRIAYLVDSGISPCIVGSWGYHLCEMGVEKMQKHWRYLIARYGAYPVFWCAAGEATMHFYLSEKPEEDAAFLKKGWTEVTRYIRETDPFHRLLTVHPTSEGRDQVEDPSLLDFEFLQTGHSDRESVPNTVKVVKKAVAREPRIPVINSEVCYEGIGEACRQELQRLMFWICILEGAAGHTYGANGIWQINSRENPYGPSPHGLAWGNTPWDEAYKLPGSGNLGLSKSIIDKYEWWNFEPHPEWVEPHWSEKNYIKAYAAGIPGKIRVIYSPCGTFGALRVKGVEPGANYSAVLIDPMDGERIELGKVTPDENGDWLLPVGKPPNRFMPRFQDWILILESLL